MTNRADPDLLQTSRVLREAYERGKQQGERRGEQRGEQRGIEMVLRAVFIHQLGRALTDHEQQALAARARALDPEQVMIRALSLEGEALVGWLLDPDAK